MAQTELGHVTVIGGCGFLGHNIVNLLRKQYPQTRISVIDLRTDRNRNESKLVSYHDCDITNEPDVSSLFAKLKPTAIIHTASPVFVGEVKRDLFYKVNVEGTSVLLKAAQKYGVRAFVYTSSASVITSKETVLVNADERWPVITGDDAVDYYSVTKVRTSTASCKQRSALASIDAFHRPSQKTPS